MTVSGVKTTTDLASSGASSTKTNASQDSTQLSGNMEMFLKLLTTQLCNQDPTNPTDTAQFTNQLVMYAQAEQQIKTNSYLENLSGSLNNSLAANAVGYIGKEVQVVSDDLTLENSKAKFAYKLDKAAASCIAVITDDKNNIIGSITGSNDNTKLNEIVWDGTDMYGNKLADGTYHVKISATDANGTEVGVTTMTYGKVDNVAVDDEGCYIGIDGSYINVEDILSIYDYNDYVASLTNAQSVNKQS